MLEWFVAFFVYIFKAPPTQTRLYLSEKITFLRRLFQSTFTALRKLLKNYENVTENLRASVGEPLRNLKAY